MQYQHHWSQGSPPRVRGKVLCPLWQFVDAGITPACAGKRWRQEGLPCLSRDHPRVCGEKQCAPHHRLYGDGSPPRVRGKGTVPEAVWTEMGITPACAGKRRTSDCGGRVSRDHPRVCGEKAAMCVSRSGVLGSPPRVRGKAVIRSWSVWLNRITPACAGKRKMCRRAFARIWDHPRVCGEKFVPPEHAKKYVGSPPRVRGKAYRAGRGK